MNRTINIIEDYESMKEELRKIITPRTVFVCIGTNSVMFDIFGPLCGDHLKRNKIIYYGDSTNNVNGVNMMDRLNQIYEIDGVDNKDIIAIDAAITKYDYRLNRVQITDESGILPGAGVGRKFPMIGNKSIKMFTLMEKDVKKAMEGYRTCKGMLYDKSDLRSISITARLLCKAIKEVYNEVKLVQSV